MKNLEYFDKFARTVSHTSAYSCVKEIYDDVMHKRDDSIANAMEASLYSRSAHQNYQAP